MGIRDVVTRAGYFYDNKSTDIVERLEPACEFHDLAQDRLRESFDELRMILRRAQDARTSLTAHGDSSTGSELKAVEETCREASRTVEPLEPLMVSFRTLMVSLSNHRNDSVLSTA
jgi:hypothetical protein